MLCNLVCLYVGWLGSIPSSLGSAGDPRRGTLVWCLHLHFSGSLCITCKYNHWYFLYLLPSHSFSHWLCVHTSSVRVYEGRGRYREAPPYLDTFLLCFAWNPSVHIFSGWILIIVNPHSTYCNFQDFRYLVGNCDSPSISLLIVLSILCETCIYVSEFDVNLTEIKFQ